jgi:hypothetical protein
MSVDLHFTDSGDLAIASNGDLALTLTEQERIRQQAVLRLCTERGDFVPYPQLGASLQRLIGMPNTPDTAKYGEQLIRNALTKDSMSKDIKIETWPINNNTLRFQINISYGNTQDITITLDQILV